MLRVSDDVYQAVLQWQEQLSILYPLEEGECRQGRRHEGWTVNEVLRAALIALDGYEQSRRGI